MIKEIKNAVTIPRHGEGPYWTPSSLISGGFMRSIDESEV
jgi:hypothetical protein